MAVNDNLKKKKHCQSIEFWMTSMLFLLPLTTVNLACYLPTDWLSRTLVIKVIEDLKETKKISLAIYLCIYLVLWLCSYMKINFYLFFLSLFFFLNFVFLFFTHEVLKSSWPNKGKSGIWSFVQILESGLWRELFGIPLL